MRCIIADNILLYKQVIGRGNCAMKNVLRCISAHIIVPTLIKRFISDSFGVST